MRSSSAKTLLVLLAASTSVEAAAIRPFRVLSEGGTGFRSVARAEEQESWILIGRDSVWRLKDGDTKPTCWVLHRREGGILEVPFRAGASADRLLIQDIGHHRMIEVDAGSGRATKETPSRTLGGEAAAGIGRAGRNWILAGGFRDRSGRPLEIQARAADSLELRGGMPLSPEESLNLRGGSESGAVASGPNQMALVVFQAISRAIVVNERAEELISLVLPIPSARRLDASHLHTPPVTAEQHESLYRGRTVPMGAGWMGEDPAVLLVDLNSGADAVRWCRFSIRNGRLVQEIRLALPSHDANDSFSAAYSARADRGTLMVLGGSRRARSLYEFRIPVETRKGSAGTYPAGPWLLAPIERAPTSHRALLKAKTQAFGGSK